MRSVWRFLASRWFISFVGAALLAALVWFFGYLLGFLGNFFARAGVCGAILLVWLVANLLLDWRRRRADRALAEGVAAISPGEAARAEEVASLREKLTTALALLRRASGTRGYLYEQPWYVIIGPPGAGKTTALLNAGLKFPLAAEMGQGAVAGVGGTRLCDWWFTEQAVLIDTAGRYTTQDSDAAVDRAGWDAFLDLLRRTRPRQPLNGVLVAIGAPELAQAAQGERLDHARAIRRRIKELTERLGLRLPVYMLFTKADLLAGFTEYFDDLDRSARDQVWGHTFDYSKEPPGAGPINGWAEALRGLIARLNAKLVDRLQAERSPDRRALLAGFPAQLASLEAPLGEFLAEAFGGSRLDPAPLLRGVYFTSGTQAGTPIDRLTGVLARNFGVDQQRAPSLRPQQGRSYFLGDLLQLVFGEAMLGSARPGAARRRTLLRAAGFIAIALITIGLATALLSVRATQQADAARLAAGLGNYEQLAGATQIDPVTDDDLQAVLPLLDAARTLPFGESSPEPGLGLGVSQAEKYATGTRLLYRNALRRILLPRLLLRLEKQMRDKLEKPEFLYEATRVYLMLGSQGPMDRDLVRAWEQLDWRQRYPDPAVQSGLTQHLDALLAIALPEVPLDWSLLADARRTFSRVPVAVRVYSRIRPSAAAQAVPEWTPAAALGASGEQVFYRSSGRPLATGVPGFFTKEGFYTVLLPGLPDTARQVAGESWVLGEKSAVNPTGGGLASLQAEVVKLYEQDYIHTWDAMLADLQMQPLNGTEEGIRTLYILGSPQSPLHDLLASITQQLALAKPPPEAARAEGALAKAAAASGSAGAQLSSLFGQDAAKAAPGQAVEDHNAALIAYVGHGPGAPLDLAIKLLGDLQQQLAAAAGSAGGAAPAVASGGDAAALLRAEAARAPPPVNRWLNIIAGGSSAARASGAKAAAKAAFAAPGGPKELCGAAVEGRYPFSRNATNEIPLDDFAKLFAPGGELDAFFRAQIMPFVDTTGRVWRPKEVDGVAAPISAGDLAAFQRAAAIRDLFFAAGGNTPSVRFDITPEYLDVGAKQVTLDLGGMDITYAHGPLRATLVTWPGQGPGQAMDSARLSFDPPPGALEAQGPWALFRLIDKGTLSPGASPEQYELSFSAGPRQVRYQIRAGSVLNPFAPGVLQGFRCPSLK